MNVGAEEVMEYEEARDLILGRITPLPEECVPLSDSAGRILARDVIAREDVPAFDRSPYDGYAFRAEDTRNASRERPVTLRILEEIPAGSVPHMPVTPGTAVKILTGAPIPDGADAVVKYEETRFNFKEATLFGPFQPGSNIVRVGEDVKEGDVLAHAGERIDPGTAGTLAAQGVSMPWVYRRPRVGILSTGSELQDLDTAPKTGKIRDTSRYVFEAALLLAGCLPVFLGIVGDNERDIAGKITEGLSSCDALLLTGGVSAGDYDKTPAALSLAGAEIVARDLNLKPGGKCVYAVKGDRLLCCLSGNPASALTNYYAVALPALRKLAGRSDYLSREIDVRLGKPFNKKSPMPRLLRGKLNFIDGVAFMDAGPQGNAVLSSAMGNDVMAFVPAGSGALSAGIKLKGFLL